MAHSIAHIARVPALWILHVAHMRSLMPGKYWVYMISTTRTRDSIYRKPQEKVISRIRVDPNPLRHWLISTNTHPQQAFFMLNCIMGPFDNEAEARLIVRAVSQGTRGSERRYVYMMNWARAHQKRFLPLVMPATLICNPLFLPDLLSSTTNWGIISKNHVQANRKKNDLHPGTKPQAGDHEPKH
jgi:hypothetical protein